MPISVTLVKPASIDTPFFEKAKTYLGVEPQPVPPVYAPEVVVGGDPRTRAQHPVRELIAGGSGAKLSAARFAPRLADLYMERWTFDSQSTVDAGRRAGRQPVRRRWPTTAANAAATGPGIRGAAASTPRRSCIRESQRPPCWSGWPPGRLWRVPRRPAAGEPASALHPSTDQLCPSTTFGTRTPSSTASMSRNTRTRTAMVSATSRG